MCLPSWFVITALRRTFSAGIVKACIDSSNTIGKSFKVYPYRLPDSDLFTRLECSYDLWEAKDYADCACLQPQRD